MSSERSDKFEEVDLSGYNYVPGGGERASDEIERGSIAKSETGSKKVEEEDVEVKVEPVGK